MCSETALNVAEALAVAELLRAATQAAALLPPCERAAFIRAALRTHERAATDRRMERAEQLLFRNEVRHVS